MKFVSGGVCAAKGFTASGIHCGIRKNRTKRDLSLIYSEVKSSAAAVYTTNLVKGAPLEVTKVNIQDGYAQAVICNSGNANTCNADGITVAQKTCELLSESLGVNATIRRTLGADIDASCGQLKKKTKEEIDGANIC